MNKEFKFKIIKKKRLKRAFSKRQRSIKKKYFSFSKLHIKLLLIFISAITYFIIFPFPSNILQKKKGTTTKVGLCIICKTENLYIKEFVDYYKNIGYNHIFIYDNNDKDGERLEDVIQKDIDEGFVSIIDFRGDKDRPIFTAYRDCYSKNSNTYDWLSFFDIDEFLELKPEGIKIQEFLNNERYKDCQVIKINWLLYSDDDKMYYENKPVIERFKTALYDNHLNQLVKSTIRGHLPTNIWLPPSSPHSPSDENYTYCNPAGQQIEKNSAFNFKYNYTYALIRHYRTKTIEEYINKIKKGKPDGNVDNEYMITMFFYTNKRTKEKMDYFREKLKLI